MKYLTGFAALMLIAAPAVQADEDIGPYVGVGVGEVDIEIEQFDEGDFDFDGDFDSDDTSLKIFGGWRFNPFFAVELAYIDFGSPSQTIGPTRFEADVTGIAPYVIGTLPLGPVELYGKAGYVFYDVDFSASDGIDEIVVADSGDDFAYGAGIGMTFFDHLNTRLEYEVIELSDDIDANTLWLSANWRF